MRRPCLRRDDGAVTEVLGFILSFALSAMFLMIALSAFHTARGNTDAAVTAVEIRSIADRVAARVVEASLVGQEFPNATMSITISIPAQVNGHDYRIVAQDAMVVVETLDGIARAESKTFRLEVVQDVTVTGQVLSAQERIVVRHNLVGTEHMITISEE